ncbi:hypothetical protein [uncultured Brevibacterium sp.]|uniref:hypothetical protein n=1 Tax=uncultured Brevibacterium sp. TaxID=189678 RepID=UPI0025D2417A|nr:hypothetical protein [uncultured Brevibacterium sp.]
MVILVSIFGVLCLSLIGSFILHPIATLAIIVRFIAAIVCIFAALGWIMFGNEFAPQVQIFTIGAALVWLATFFVAN